MSGSQENVATIEKVLLREKDKGIYINEIEMEQLRRDYLPIMKGYANILRDMSQAAMKIIHEDSKEDVEGSMKSLHTIIRDFFETTSKFYIGEEDNPAKGNLELSVQMKFLEKIWPVTKKVFFKMFDALKEIGSDNELKFQLEIIKDDWRILHDAYTFAINAILKMISDLYAPELVIHLLKETARINKVAYDKWDTLDTEAIGKVVRGLLIAHGSQFEIIKSKEKIEFDISYCASGGKLMKQIDINKMPVLGLEGTEAKGRIANKCNYMPYCAHCKIWNEILPKEWYGKEMFYVEPDLVHLESCKLIVKAKE